MKNLRQDWELTKSSVITILKLRNEGSILGFLWYLINPLLMFLILYFIFSQNIGQNIEYYPLYIIIGLIVWNLMGVATTVSINTIKFGSSLIKSIKFPSEILVISPIIASLIQHLFEVFILSLILIFFKINPIYLLFYFPVLLFLIIFSLGISFILSSLYVYFTDLDSIWVFVIRLWWLATPIFYSINMSPKIAFINQFNPMFYFIDISRTIIIYNSVPSLEKILIMVFFSLFSLIVGYFIFNKFKSKFTELV